MKKKTTAIISAIIALTICLAIVVPTVFAIQSFADTLDEQYNRNNQEKDEIKKELDEKKGERQEAERKKRVVDDEIGSLVTEIDALNKKIKNNEIELEKIEEEIAAIEDKISESDALLKKRLRVMYEKGTSSYLDIIFSAESFSDMLVRADMIAQIVDSDQEMMKGLLEQKAKIEEAKKKIEEIKAENESARNDILSQKKTLDAKSAESQGIIDDLRSDEAYLQEQYNLRVAENNRILREIEAARRANGNTSPSAYTGGQLGWPSTQRGTITSEFGQRTFRGKLDNHTGIDIGLPMGTPVLAAEDGVVLSSGWRNGGYGYCVTIDHGSITTLYAHNSVLQCSAGQRVKRGDQIALVGSTGNSTGPHIHFGVIDNTTGKYVNPRPYIF